MVVVAVMGPIHVAAPAAQALLDLVLAEAVAVVEALVALRTLLVRAEGLWGAWATQVAQAIQVVPQITPYITALL